MSTLNRLRNGFSNSIVIRMFILVLQCLHVCKLQKDIRAKPITNLVISLLRVGV